MLQRVDRLFLRLATWLACAGLGVLILFAAATLLDGLSRSLTDRPIDVVGDAGPFLVAASVAACFPLAHLQRSNITIELAELALGAHIAQVMRALAAVLVGVVIVAMARQMLLYAGQSATGGDTTVLLGIPTAPFWYVVALMFGCAAAMQVLVVLTEFVRCAQPPALRRSQGPG